MADSIIYEHNSIEPNKENKFIGSYRLVELNGQVISISTNQTSYNDDESSFLIITNLDTKKEIIRLKTNICYLKTSHLTVFKYSKSILWVGFLGRGCLYHVWIVDLETLIIIKNFKINSVNIILPVGQEYFIVESLSYVKPKVYTWNNLIKLDKLDDPIKQLEKYSRIYPIDWSSSSIKYLGSCAFIQTQMMSYNITFLDKNFNYIISINVQDLFTNYQYIPGVNPSRINKLITVNDNCLLYWEYTDIYLGLGNIEYPGQTNIYCWDFTFNSQVKFSNYKFENSINYVKPFRNPNNPNQVKYFAEYFDDNDVYSKVYESIS